MKIGIYSPYLDTLGGGEKYMLTAASCLSSQNDVSIFWEDKNILGVSQNKFNIDLSKVKVVDNIFSPNTSTIKRFKESRQFDAIFFLSDGSIPLVSSKLFVHFQFPVEWVNSKSILEGIKLKRVSAFICNSNFTKEHIDLKFGVNGVVVYPPTYFVSDFPKVDFKNKKNIILNVGRYGLMPDGSSFKKQEFLIDSFIKLLQKGLKNWELNLVISYQKKDKEYIEKMKKTAKDYPIKIFENISYDQLSNLYSESKIYWHASGYGEDLITHPEKAEHFGITTVEAMMNGVVPVVINAGGQMEIVKEGDSGYLWNEEEELLLKTMLLANDSEKLISTARNAVISAKVFSTDVFCEKINKIFIK